MTSAPDHRLAAIAMRRGGTITRAQLRACGLSAAAIRRRVRSGALVPYGPDIFQVGPFVTADGHRIAALDLGGPQSELSHFSASDCLDAGPRDPHRHHITVPRGRHPARVAHVAVHHARDLRPDDVITIRGIRTTAPPRTALDLATVVSAPALSTLVTRMLHARLLLPSTFQTLSADHRGHPGLARLLALAPTRTPTESPLEDRVRDLILDGLPLPDAEAQLWVAGISGRRYRADFAYVDAKVLVEADSRSVHDRNAAFDDDRERDADLAAVGWLTLRITHQHVDHRRMATRQRVTETVLTRLVAAP